MNTQSHTTRLAHLILGALVALVGLANAPVLAAAQTPPTSPTAPVKLVSKTLAEIDGDKHIEIKLTYAQILSPTAKLQGFNAAAEKQATDLATSFKKEMQENQPIPDGPMTSTIDLNYAVLNNRKGLISVRGTVGYYAAGAAHPNSYSIVLNYDAVEGKALDLVDLFKPDVKYLDVLATYCKAALKRRNRLDFPEGADPVLQNYDAWNITPRGLLINFDPYQVMAYAAGPQQCLVPYATLAKVLKEPARLR